MVQIIDHSDNWITFLSTKKYYCNTIIICCYYNKKQKTPWIQSAKRTIPTERPPLVGEVSAHFSG
jgi:hypothetical protein